MKIYQEKVFEGFWSHFIKVRGLQSRIYTLLKNKLHAFFRGHSEKTAVLANFQKNVFFGVTFNQFGLSNLLPIAILGIDSAANVSCERPGSSVQSSKSSIQHLCPECRNSSVLFGRTIWHRLPECIYVNFEITQVEQEQFQNLQKSWGSFILKIAVVTGQSQHSNKCFVLKPIYFNKGQLQIINWAIKK